MRLKKRLVIIQKLEKCFEILDNLGCYSSCIKGENSSPEFREELSKARNLIIDLMNDVQLINEEERNKK